MSTRSYCTPEDVMSIATDAPTGYPIDAIDCALSRADAVLVLMSGQFDGTGAQQLSDEINANAIWAVRGELAMLRKLIAHGDATEATE